MKKERYAVTGMTCSACSAHVQKAVAAVPGVHSVQVNLLQNNMTVEFEEAETTPETIFAAVKKAFRIRNGCCSSWWNADCFRSCGTKSADLVDCLFDSTILYWHGAYAQHLSAAVRPQRTQQHDADCTH